MLFKSKDKSIFFICITFVNLSFFIKYSTFAYLFAFSKTYHIQPEGCPYTVVEIKVNQYIKVAFISAERFKKKCSDFLQRNLEREVNPATVCKSGSAFADRTA